MDKQCINPKCGELIHAFELQILSQADTVLFEEHLLSCAACFDDVQQMSPVVDLITREIDLHAIDNAEKEVNAKESVTRSSRSLENPRTFFESLRPLILRPALLFVVIGLMSYPAYIGLNELLQTKQVNTVQALSLHSHRSSSEYLFEYDPNQDLVLSFICPAKAFNEAPTVTLVFQDTLRLTQIPMFGDFDRYNTGRILVPKALLRDGEFSLHITDPADIELYQFPFVLRRIY